ncbi:MAG TPA: type II toxin-antitoxin system VapB family antitoxin [Thermoanaerobaculia bacterium]|nr:type II toxin-antitoxin system VapB family antitoxin [Thermoanaerobaculia bacterium]
MRKTSVEIDEDLLSKAQEILATSSIKDTINEAFLALIRQEAIRAEIEALRKMEGMDLADPEIMAGAWR